LLVAIEAVWLAAVWKGWDSLQPALQGAIKASMQGAVGMHVAMMVSGLILFGWCDFSYKHGSNLEFLIALILGGTNIGAVFGAIFGAWGAGRRKEPAPDGAQS